MEKGSESNDQFNEVQEKQKQNKQKWSVSDLKKLFEFILLNPHIVGSGTSCQETIKLAHDFIGHHIDYEKCYRKMDYLKGQYHSYESIVSSLKKKIKVDQKWIQQKRIQSNYFPIQNFQNQIQSLRQSETMQKTALRLFISNFSYQDAMIKNYAVPANNIDKSSHVNEEENLKVIKSPHERNNTDQKIVFIQILNKKKPSFKDQIITLNVQRAQNQFSESKSKFTEKLVKQMAQNTSNYELNQQKGWNYIQKIRYVLFIEKYKLEFDTQNETEHPESLFSRMAKFIGTKSKENCFRYHCKRANRQKNLEKIINNAKENIYVKQKQAEIEIKSIKALYQKDFNDQMIAFKRHWNARHQTSDAEISVIAKYITEKLENMNLMNSNCAVNSLSQSSKTANGMRLQLRLKDKPIMVRFLIELNVSFIKIQELQIKQKNVSQIQQKTNNQLTHQQNYKPKSSKRITQTLEKKQIKKNKIKSKIKGFLQKEIMKSQPLFEDDDEHLCIDEDDFFGGNQAKTQKKNKCQKIQNQKKKVRLNKNKGKSEFTKLVIGQKESQRNQIQNIERKKSSVKSRAMKQKDQQIEYWSISQQMKILSFLLVNKEKFKSENYNDIRQRNQQMVRYIGTSKQIKNCQSRIRNLKLAHQNQWQSIQLKAKRLSITQNLLNQCKILEKQHVCQSKISLESKISLDNSSLLLNVYPVLHLLPPPEKIENQLKRIIKNGPFINVQLKTNCKKTQKNTNTDLTKSQNDITVIEIPHKLMFWVSLGIPSKLWEPYFISTKELKLQSEWKLLISDKMYV